MNAHQLSLDDIIQMTLEVGEDWAVSHAERLLRLIEQIGADAPYDEDVIELAAYMHDWGYFPPTSKRMWNTPSVRGRWCRRRSCPISI